MPESKRVQHRPRALRMSRELKVKIAAILIVLFFLGTAAIAMISGTQFGS